MWELGYKESCVLKNWCFLTVVLEKTLESPLDCKEIQPVHPKGDQLWILIGKTDAKAEAPILWPPDAKSWLVQFSSVQFSHSVVSDSLQPHGLQHDRLPYPSPTPRDYSDSGPSSRWCHPAIPSPSPPTFNLSQHQGLFQWVGSLHQVAKVLKTCPLL